MTLLAYPAALPGVLLLQPQAHRDARGSFTESWSRADFARAVGRDPVFCQDNESESARGVLRGLHWQAPPHAQAKLVRCASGAVFDVAVDLRQGSPTFGRWCGTTLSAENRLQAWIPEGFAHGFLALSERALVLYKVTAPRVPGAERRIRWDDPAVGIRWPLAGEPLLSEKDRGAPLLAEAGGLFPAKEPR